MVGSMQGKATEPEFGPGGEVAFLQQEDVYVVKLNKSEDLIGLRGGPI